MDETARHLVQTPCGSSAYRDRETRAGAGQALTTPDCGARIADAAGRSSRFSGGNRPPPIPRSTTAAPPSPQHDSEHNPNAMQPLAASPPPSALAAKNATWFAGKGLQGRRSEKCHAQLATKHPISDQPLRSVEHACVHPTQRLVEAPTRIFLR
ncbi:hypothetical protein BDK51DRAFT_39218 [Blyttiomyces helicus]|uniref:Uncharacterized protein n=1 Tax=Blyttiomyces helicus TaxID=388810 RepID=A0A4P9VYR1_9FUNG|nr:hypothetical protein BDK51DRAFT_39218 [Blyttiomyces helicus]|eukprot:RKO84105.1 hypothetical protein BDK51DRAFT_39218 [Blyttiomyces helicus]